MLYVANTTRGEILAIPIRGDGSAGAVTSVAGGVFFDDEGTLVGDFRLFPLDGIAVDLLGNLYPLRIGAHELVRIRPDGSRLTVLADAEDGLDFPASVTFGASRGYRTTVFITNFSIQPGLDQPAVLKLDVRLPGAPVLGWPLP
jgi:sugar lactone lactonase YvrE